MVVSFLFLFLYPFLLFLFCCYHFFFLLFFCAFRRKTLLIYRYCTSAQADEILYPHCPKEYREEGYRMQVVAGEIRGHGADLIMLQVIVEIIHTPPVHPAGWCWWR